MWLNRSRFPKQTLKPMNRKCVSPTSFWSAHVYSMSDIPTVSTLGSISIREMRPCCFSKLTEQQVYKHDTLIRTKLTRWLNEVCEISHFLDQFVDIKRCVQ